MLYRRRKPSEEAGMKGVRLWTAAATAVAAGCAVAPAWAAEGGTLRVNISNSDVQSLDPAIDYEIYGWTVEFATCAKLLNYPDKPGAAGSQLLPEVAAGFPSVSADGRTYTFHLRNTFRFSDGSQVTAASFSRAIERGLSKKMSSAAASFVGDIVGADAVTAGKATHPSGVTTNGDTLVVKLNKVRLNRDSAISSGRIASTALNPAYVERTRYQPDFDSNWVLDREKGVARLKNPSEHLKNYTVKLQPMVGCLAVAPPAHQAFRTGYPGTFGGNMDYNQIREGTTVYLPVSVPGALVFIGDGHAAQGDGELTGNALETSLDVEFTVDVISGRASNGPRSENSEYLMSSGIGNSLSDALQLATTQLVNWLQDDYALTPNEAAVVLGTAMQYDIAEVVDPLVHVVAKIRKDIVAQLK